MKLIEKIVFSKNVWTVTIAMIVMWLAFSGMGAMLKPQKPNVFLNYFYLVVFSFLIAVVVVEIIYKILGLKFVFKGTYVDPKWIFVLILGSCFFTYLFQDTTFANFGFFTNVFVLGFVPASLFRIFINLIMPFLSKSTNSEVSIIDR